MNCPPGTTSFNYQRPDSGIPGDTKNRAGKAQTLTLNDQISNPSSESHDAGTQNLGRQRARLGKKSSSNGTAGGANNLRTLVC